ncbi:MAG TPA: hypothetical protein PK961_13460 [bacterium]|nr:hypothetical protein [bacterium]
MRNYLIVCLAILVLFTAACNKKAEVAGEEAMEPKPEATEEDTGIGLPQVAAGDHLLVELTVYHPRYVYLSGDSPVTVFTPAMPGFTFLEKKIDMKTPSFPMIINCAVDRNAPKGKNVLKLGVKITYTDKADESTSHHNALVEVPVQVIPQNTARMPQNVNIPVEHYLELDNAIEVKDPQ